jgi:hypothetical protein
MPGLLLRATNRANEAYISLGMDHEIEYVSLDVYSP